MPKTTTTELVFCCPNCGADLRASRHEAGTILDCLICGEHVRVPKQPHPVEAPEAAQFATPREILLAAAQGLRFLTLATYLLLLEYSILAATYLFWTQTEGIAAVLKRQPGSLAFLLILMWILEAGLVIARTGCRWWGYRQLEALTRQVTAPGWVIAARFSTLLRLVGYGLMVVPWLAQMTWPLQGFPAAMVKLGQFAWTLGVGLEFTILVPWYRLLRRAEGPQRARSVTLYGIANALAVLLGSIGISLVGMFIIMVVRASGGLADGRTGRINPAEVPERGWVVAGCFLAVVALGWLGLMIWQQRLLRRLRAAIHAQLLETSPRSL